MYSISRGKAARNKVSKGFVPGTTQVACGCHGRCTTGTPRGWAQQHVVAEATTTTKSPRHADEFNELIASSLTRS